MVERAGFPAAGGVARGAIRPERSLVEIVFLMAGITGLRRGLQVVEIAVVHMAAAAFDLSVFSAQGEGNRVMVEGSAVRIHPVVTGHAIRPEGENVFLHEGRVVIEMAIGADILIEGLGVSGGMAICAGERRAVGAGLVSGQCEADRVMVEGGGFPAIGGMAGAALCSKPAGVGVVLEVTGDTIGWRAFEDAARVTSGAFHNGVFALQFEGKL